MGYNKTPIEQIRMLFFPKKLKQNRVEKKMHIFIIESIIFFGSINSCLTFFYQAAILYMFI